MLFPRYSFWIVFFVTLSWRLYYVSQRKNWWILHPDEVFQILEVAHSELYGYGFRPYEYLPDEKSEVSIARAQELDLGMYSLRSFIVPKIFVMIAYISDRIGFQGHHFLVWKLFHAVVTSFLPVSVFRFAFILTKSRDISMLSCILTASSVTLGVFGTHTLINSFLSPFIFSALSDIFQFMDLNRLSKPDIIHNKYPSESKEYNDKKCGLRDHNQNNFDFDMNSSESPKEKCFNPDSEQLQCKGIHHRKKPLQEMAEEASGHVTNSRSSICSKSVRSAFSTFVLGICVYIRPDSLVLIVFLFLPYSLDIFKQRIHICRKFVVLLTSFSVALLLCALDDVVSYGSLVLSPIQWIKFNVLSNYSSVIFGSSEFNFYFKEVFYRDVSALTLLSLFASGFLIQLIYKDSALKCSVKLLFSVVSIFMTYSFQKHKELRFIHDVLPFIFILYSSAFMFIMDTVSNNKKRAGNFKLLLFSSFSFYVASQISIFPSDFDLSSQKWTYMGRTDTSHVNECLNFVSKQNDVTGVFLDRSVHMTGAFSVLHRNVFLLSLIHNEFKEFDNNQSRYISQSVFDSRSHLSLSIHSKVSNYISVYNTPYLLKVLIENQNYNYLVMKCDRKFIDFGYEEVFKSGSMHVLKRKFSLEDEDKLRAVALGISMGDNPRILNYEASWLLTFELYQLAESKLHQSLKLQMENLQAFQLLLELYKRKGNSKDARSVLKYCLSKFPESDCRDKPNRDVIHSIYKKISSEI
ncbi:hypothetical protein FSP39_019458 [Pinctada imbricata]|uniref:Mannosyltransferase n=1 Tax=Pinctada imbricata TaxID=66713 RepID=A0AA88XP40_PINIB|nr:hypothetical protein FSP39_019458 [Pinctada imbricata]